MRVESLVILASIWLAAAPGSAERQSSSEDAIAEAIRRLGAGQFAVREEATDYLWSVGGPAVQALEQASESDEREVRLRARKILERFRYGIFPQTPQREVQLINRFRYGNQAEKKAAFEKLQRTATIPTLLTLLETVQEPADLRYKFQLAILRRLESDGEIERALELVQTWMAEHADPARQKALDSFMGRQVPYLLAHGKLERAESILQRAASSEDGQRDWAVYVALRGETREQVEQLQAQTADSPSDDDLRQLAFLLRADGQLAEARQAAERIEESPNAMLRGILFEMRQWKALSDLHHELIENDPAGLGKNVEAQGYAAAFHRLAGEQERFQQTVHSLEQLAAHQASFEWSCAEALIVNGLIDEGVEILRRRMPAFAFQLLCVQDRYRDAFRLVGIESPQENHLAWFESAASQAADQSSRSNQQFEVAVQVARKLQELGEHEQARQGFSLLADAVQSDRRPTRLEKVCEAEYQSGLTDAAFGHAAISLSKGRTAILDTLFSGSDSSAELWWEFLRETGQRDSYASSLRRLRSLFEPPQGGLEELDNLLERAERFAEQYDEKKRARWSLALARVCQLHSRPDRARNYLEQAAAASVDAAIELGDISAAEENWEQAAEWYRRAWTLDRTQALPLYLRGHALSKAGQSEEGERCKQVARLVPLADSQSRMDLARGLQKRQLRDEAVDQFQLMMRSGRLRVTLDGQFRDTTLVDAQKLYANSLSEDLEAKADHWELMHLSCLEAPLWIPTFRGYFHTPHLIYKTRARDCLEADRLGEAKEFIERAQELLPANTELVEDLLPRLEEAGQQQLADQLFDQCYAFVEELCMQFPNSPSHRNNLAWMSARCDRRLDDALRHAQHALELAPNKPSYLDTLAEIHFRRGEAEKAVEYAKRCLELEPQNEFFEEQLQRFQKAMEEAS